MKQGGVPVATFKAEAAENMHLLDEEVAEGGVRDSNPSLALCNPRCESREKS